MRGTAAQEKEGEGAAYPHTRRRVDHRAEGGSTALTSAPATKPSCTELVRAAVPVDESPHRRARAGATADALNHGAIASSSAAASRARTRRALTAPSGDPGIPRGARSARGDARQAP